MLTGHALQFRQCKRLPPQVKCQNMIIESTAIHAATSLAGTASACGSCMKPAEIGPATLGEIVTEYECFKQDSVDSMTPRSRKAVIGSQPEGRHPPLRQLRPLGPPTRRSHMGIPGVTQAAGHRVFIAKICTLPHFRLACRNDLRDQLWCEGDAMTYPYLLFRQTPEQLRRQARAAVGPPHATGAPAWVPPRPHRGFRRPPCCPTPRPWPKPSPPWMLSSPGCGGPRSASQFIESKPYTLYCELAEVKTRRTRFKIAD